MKPSALVVFRERDGEQIDVRVARDVACEHNVLEIGTLGRSAEILLQSMQLGTACAHALAQAFGPGDFNLADGCGDTRCPTFLRGLDSIRARYGTAQRLRKDDARHGVSSELTTCDVGKGGRDEWLETGGGRQAGAAH